jgi:hypothetical protein
MTRSRIAVLFAVVLGCLALPATARAQSAFAGVVKDATGAVLPGVTVEASSPALIEKVRSVTTDANGLYRIENLRPGTYTITFNLPGFSAVKRDGVELPSNFTSTINADLKVGAMEETVTVSGQSPVVDVQSNSKAQVLSREMLDAVPTSHTIQGVGQLVVGVTLTAPDVGGSQAMQQTYFTVHGLGAAQTSLMMDGMIINGLQGDGAIQTYTNDAGNQEMVYQTGGGTVDSPTGGVKINMIPKEGGNRFSGSLFQGYETTSMQGDNLTSFLQANGLKSVDKIGTYNDTNFTFGGPIKKDTVWFFGSGRFFIVNKPIGSTYVSDGTKAGIIACANALAGRGGTLCPQGVDPNHQYSGLARITWQISPRNKLSGYYDRIHKVRGAAMSGGDDQTTSSVVWNSPLYTTNMIKYTSTVSSKLLVEGGFSSNIERYNNLYQPGIEKEYGTPAWFANARHSVDNGASTNTASATQYGSYPDRYNMQASASYVTGSNSIKVGFQDSWGPYNQNLRANADLYQNYTTSATTGLPVPSTVTLLATPSHWQDRLNANLGIYGQDVMTFKRATITLGGRFEYISEQITGQDAQLGRFVNIPAFSDKQMPTWKNFSPRTSMVYDLMGDGKTAVRFGYNRFGVAATTTLASLYDPAAGTVINAAGNNTAPWTDKNGDDIAQGSSRCNFADQGCEINFANIPANFGVISLAQPDPGLTRPYVDQFNLGATREVSRGVSVSAEWFHNDARNSWERNNVLRPGTYSNGTVSNASYRPVTVFSPIDGTPITLYDVVASAATAVQNVDTNDSDVKQSYNAFEFNFQARLPHGARMFGGSATDRTIANTCSASASNPNFLVTIGGVNYCDQTKSGIPWRTQFKLAGTFPLPWYGITAAASFQALPGYILGTSALTAGGAGAPNFTSYSGVASSWTVTPTTNYVVCPGNSASQGCVVGARVVPGQLTSSFAVPLDPPGTLLTPRVNQLDLSFSKRITVRGIKFDPKIDFFNALNSDDYFSVRGTVYSPTTNASLTTPVTRGSAGTYLQPNAVLQGRIVRLGAVVTW